MIQPLLSYGPTLARVMPRDDASLILDRLCREGRVDGLVHVAVTRDTTPNVRSVDAIIDDIEPTRAIEALTAVLQRLSQLHGKKLPPLVVDKLDGVVMRKTAEDLVDQIRSCTTGWYLQFDLTREECIEAVMVALITAPVSSSLAALQG